MLQSAKLLAAHQVKIRMNTIFKNIIFFGIVLLLVGCSSAPGEETEGLQVPESPLLRYFERKTGRILYLSMDGNLYTINQAGEEGQQITQDGNLDLNSEDFRAYIHFAWSPDSEKIAYVGLSQQQYTIHTVNADGTEPVENFASADGQPVYLSWTPDSETVCFLTDQWLSGQDGVQMHSLNTQETADDAEVTMLGRGEYYYGMWEPGRGSKFLAHITRDSESRVMLIDPGEPVHETTLKLLPGTFHTPAWAPDGKQLLIAMADPDTHANELVITDLEGQILNRLGMVGNSTAFSWAPDGAQVAYISSVRKWGPALGPLTVQNVDNPEEKFTVDDPYISAFFWSPDSQQIAYFTLEVTTGDVQAESNSGFSSLLTLYALDVKSGERKNLLSFYPTVPFLEVLQGFDQYQYSTNFWSPDSENFVISSSIEGGTSAVIVVVPVSGNLAPRPIAEGLMGIWSSK
jgi:Tol biopolymer transport system component